MVVLEIRDIISQDFQFDGTVMHVFQTVGLYHLLDCKIN